MADEEQHYWPAWDSDGGQLPAATGVDEAVDGPTETLAPVEPPATAAASVQPGGGLLDDGAHGVAQEPPVVPAQEGGFRAGLGRSMMIAGAALALFVIIYVIDLIVSWGDVPRGVTVAGVEVGGLDRTAAEEKLRSELDARFDDPVRLVAGDVVAVINPTDAGLGVDWQGTLEQAGRQPLSPITRLTSFFDTREVGIVGTANDEVLAKTVREVAKSKINRKKREGDIKFTLLPGSDENVKAEPVAPRDGQKLASLPDAVTRISNDWLNDDGVRLDVTVQRATASEAGVRATLDRLVKPAVAAPIEVLGDGVTATLTPKNIGDAFSFVPEKNGSLKAKVDQEALKEALQPQLASTEQEGRDAQIVFSGSGPTVEPSQMGRKIEWAKTLDPYLEVIERTDDRTLEVSYAKKKPEVTTKEAEALGIEEVIGEFTTGGFAPDSGQNIKRVAEQVYGAIVKPGATFSLNGYTGPRTAASGYVEAGIIQDGIPGRAVGGGISQFATTLYNASYFAGMRDAGHREHSYYISRYPIAREATVFQGAAGSIDIAFTNDAPTGIAIQTAWTPSSITVKIWGTKRYEVESSTSPKSNIKEAGVRTLDDKDCTPSPGIDGFTATDTRTLRHIETGEVRREYRTVHYNPKPEIRCKKDED